MILERLQITSFAALAGVELDFAPGLNVVLGPNEAGKSTLFQAIQHTLLTPARLNKRQFQGLLGRFLPLGGGDTLGCALMLRHEGQSYRLSKHWGQDPSAELALPDGSLIASEERIRAALAPLLPGGEGSFRAVFLTAQSGLARTLEELKDNPQAVGSLSDLLQRAAFETDGVSIARFRSLLDAQADRLLGHWDLERSQPEDGRAIDHPWEREVGEVLAAWYEQERLARQRSQAEEQEERFGLLARELAECRARLRQVARRVEEQAPSARGVLERRALEAERERIDSRLHALQSAFDRWPQLEQRVAQVEQELPAAVEQLAALERERQLAESSTRLREQKARFERLGELKAEQERTQSRLRETPALTQDELQELERIWAEAQCQAPVESAGGLSVLFRARAELTLATERDQGPAEQRKLRPGETLTFQAAERARISTPEWDLEACAGGPEAERRSRELQAARQRAQELLAARDLASLEAARQAWQRYEQQKTAARQADESYRRELGTDRYEDLERFLAQSSAQPEPRALAAVVQELLRQQARLEAMQRAAGEDSQALEALRREHGSRESVLQALVAQAAERKAVQEQIDALAPLPPGITDAETFLRQHDQDRRDLDSLGQGERDLAVECARAEENLPQESAEELARRQGEAEGRFLGLLRHGQALQRIRRACSELLAERGGRILNGYERTLGRYIEELTGHRYRSMQLAASLPESLVRGDGKTLPYGLLSGGTRDLFALALRLAMAEIFLGSGEGFLLLDDPFVALDPERQSRAAAVLERYAGEARQLLLFTCHPAHAEHFPAARRIELTQPFSS